LGEPGLPAHTPRPDGSLERRQAAGLAALAALGRAARSAPCDGVAAGRPGTGEPARGAARSCAARAGTAPRPGHVGLTRGDGERDHARRDAAPRADREPRNAQRFGYWLLLAVGLFLLGRFAYFWFSAARLPRDFGRQLDIGDMAMFAALTFVVWHRQAVDLCTWLICRRIEPRRSAPPPQNGLRVAFITTFVPGSESLAMLRGTLLTMLAADYPHDTWLLDEGDDPGVRALCAELGVGHFSRKGRETFNKERGPFLMKSKGGNHNSWYTRHGECYDVVAQVDSDFKVRRDFLTSTLGHFRNPRVAFVGTPQIYGNVDTFVARGAGQQTYLFYGPIMRSLSRRKMTLLIGANHVVRVAALKDIGWYRGHLTEDLATGKQFHARHWESVYVPEPLAIGEGPDTWTSYFNQQYRWAFGCMNIFFSDIAPLFRMRRSHGLYYFFLEMFYFSGLAMGTAITLLLLYYTLGWKAANIEPEQLILWYSPVVAWRQLMVLWLQQFSIRPSVERGILWAGRLLSIAVLPIYFLAFVGIVRNKRVTFKTTPKGHGRPQDQDSLKVFTPHLVVAALLVSGMCGGVLLGHTIWVFLAWGTVTAALCLAFPAHLLWRRLIAAIREPQAALTRAGHADVLADARGPGEVLPPAQQGLRALEVSAPTAR
jgi:cellulose synthase (UDP-forming)